MNYFSKDFIRIEKRNLKDISAGDDVESLGVKNIEKWFQIWCDIVTLPIEKLMVQFIGNRCVRRYDMRFRR